MGRPGDFGVGITLPSRRATASRDVPLDPRFVGAPRRGCGAPGANPRVLGRGRSGGPTVMWPPDARWWAGLLRDEGWRLQGLAAGVPGSPVRSARRGVRGRANMTPRSWWY